MNVSTDEIRNIPPGALRIFPCEDGRKIKSARSLVSIVKEAGLPDGVVDYELRKYNLETGLHIVIRALREGDTKILKL
jgi:hypothetical protein